MITNYFKIAIRNLKRSFTFSIINILGLTFGLAISSLIVLFVMNDLSYDKYHQDSDRIYRIFREAKFRGMMMTGPNTSGLMGPHLKETHHFVEEQTRVTRANDFILSYNENSFKEKIRFVDSTFFNVFTVKFKYGDKSTALLNPFDLVITEEIAEKIFGKVNPIGLTIKSDERTYIVRAVINNLPENTHLKYDILSSYSTKKVLNPNSKEGWGVRYNSYLTYVKLKEDVEAQTLLDVFPSIIETYLQNKMGFEYRYDLEPLEDIYLYHGGGGDLDRIILFSIIGIFVLIIACINYMNLNTAESIKRMKEIGMRKVLGAHRQELVRQLLLESILVCVLSMILALTLAELLLPVFNTILHKELRFDYFSNWSLNFAFIGLALFTGFLAGTYPAFYLSSIKPVNSLKGKFVFTSIHGRIRNALVVFQFAVTIFLLCCTGIIYLQIKHATTSDLGFNDENVMVLQISPKANASVPSKEKMKAIANQFKTEINKIPEISKVSLSSSFPFGNTSGGTFYFQDLDLEETIIFYQVDDSFIDLLEIKIIDGRAFSGLNSTEENNVVINQTMAKTLGYDNPIGKKFMNDQKSVTYTIVGVFKDFHRSSMHRKIAPMLLIYTKKPGNFMAVGCKVNAHDLKKVNAKIENLMDGYYTNFDIQHWFMSQAIQEKYEKEVNTAHMFTNFAIVAIVIACLGLYGLALFMSRQKIKEIGIRKIFGSSIKDIILKLSKVFIRLVLISALIAIPVAWYFSDKWLQSFVYQVENRWIVFVLAFLAALFIAFLTIFYQSFRAASRNPVDAIRYE